MGRVYGAFTLANPGYTPVYNGVDMMDSLSLTVIEDRSVLEGASSKVVREHFTEWAVTAPQQEQGAGAGPEQSQRYRYCIQVDRQSLESVVYKAPAPPEPDDDRDGFVNLIWKDWESGPWELPPGRKVEEEDEEPIEDCMKQDVGWMRVAYQDVMVSMYHRLRGYNSWYVEYRRPPELAHA
jgi:hypothetical protein